MRRIYTILLVLVGWGIIVVTPSFAEVQQGDSIYWKNFVRHADGSLCTHTPDAATFTAFVNSNLNTVLIESTPRREKNAEANIPGSGVFGVEFANFREPAVKVGDTVAVRFTCNATGQQGTLSGVISGVPWNYFPTTLHLEGKTLPSAPENLSLELTSQHQRLIRWDVVPGYVYSVYRSVLQDTIFNGRWRRLYQRIADSLTVGEFLDTTTVDTLTFAYIVYARNAAGIYSSHSREIFENDRITDLSVIPGATIARISWKEYLPPLGKLVGYNIYRRLEGQPFTDPIGYTSGKTEYIDSRLNPGTRYYYKITGRIDLNTEVGQSDEIAVDTQLSLDGKMTFANLKVAVVIYQHTNRGEIFDSDIPKIKAMLEAARLFYWRNSGFQLNLELEYYVISAYRGFGDPNEYHLQQTTDDLKQLGVMNTQYDIVFRICPAVYGYWSFGVINLALPGPSRKTGFSHVYWPVGTGVRYPGSRSDMDYGLTWVFVHEVQHAIDALYDANGHPEMYHGDRPWEFPVVCGEHFDFQANMLRSFNSYLDLLPDWGDIYETVDADGDKFPDNEPLLPLDEIRFGSSSADRDTDGDGLSDRQEALVGIYQGSDPNAVDSDGDGREDGSDSFPLYPIPESVMKLSGSLQINGFIETGWPLLQSGVIFTRIPMQPRLYLTYNSDSLYLALYLDRLSTPTIYLDFQGDGWWHSSGNTQITINSLNGTFSQFRSWDASDEVKTYSLNRGGPGGMWDTDPDYQNKFQRRVIDPQTVHLQVVNENPTFQIELAIPRTPYAGLNLKEGDLLGLNVVLENIDGNQQNWASFFERYDFVYLPLGSPTDIPKPLAAQVPDQFQLFPNYPNPFNPSTTIRLGVPKRTKLELVIFNVLGERVKTLARGIYSPGFHKFRWNGKDETGNLVPGGIYFCRLHTATGRIMVRKMVFLK